MAKQINKKNRKRVDTTIDERLLKRAKLLALKQDKNLNDIIEEALKPYLDKKGSV